MIERRGDDRTPTSTDTIETTGDPSDPDPVEAGRPARLDRRRRSTPVVSVIVPTYNEADNVPILIDRLRTDLAELDYEVIVVDDDSPDRTWERVQTVAAEDGRFQVVRRRTDRGLSSAVLTGMSLSAGSVLVVMDADLQHDTATIPRLVSTLLADDLDVCVASRQTAGGSYGSFSRHRRLLSWLGATAARLVLSVPVTDPMSGFFAVSRDRYRTVEDELNPLGFKILLEFMVRGPRPRVGEVGYRFGRRLHGATKLSGGVAVDYLRAITELAVGRRWSATAVAYGLVAGTAAALQLPVHGLLQALLNPSLAVGISLLGVASVAYHSHNSFTFPSRRRRGSSYRTGLPAFLAVSAYGWLVQGSITAVVDRHRPETDGSDSGTVTDLLVALEPDIGPGFAIGLTMATVATYHLHRTVVWARR